MPGRQARHRAGCGLVAAPAGVRPVTHVAVTHVAVIVPAHNEALYIEGCLRALDAAAAEVRSRRGVQVAVLVVCDACTDGTERRLGDTPHVHLQARNVGRARAVGVRTALARLDAAAAQTWVATTDADSRVPVSWLTTHLDYADAGYDAVAGTVDLRDDEPLGPRARSLYDAAYVDRWGHRHVHGANLGVRASAYLATSGFAPVRTGEDAGLLTQLERAGRPVAWTACGTVATSTRRVARAPEGFAAVLRTYEEQADADLLGDDAVA